MTLAAWLSERGVYRDLVGWAERYGDDWDRAWRECPRGDWLLAIAATLDATPRPALVRAAGACAEVALDAIDVPGARDALASALDPQLAAAARTALEAALDRAPDPAVQAALSATIAALACASDPREAPSAAAAAVQANVFAAGDCALESVVRFVHATTAERVRAEIPAPPG